MVLQAGLRRMDSIGQDGVHARLHVAQRLGVAEDVELIRLDGVEDLLRHF